MKRSYPDRPKIKLKAPAKCFHCGKDLRRGEFAYDHGNDVLDIKVCVECSGEEKHG